MMVPQITGVMNGLNIWKHQAIKRARTPIRIAISIATSMYDFSWVILSGWFIMLPLPNAARNWVLFSSLNCEFFAFNGKTFSPLRHKDAKRNINQKFRFVSWPVKQLKLCAFDHYFYPVKPFFLFHWGHDSNIPSFHVGGIKPVSLKAG